MKTEFQYLRKSTLFNCYRESSLWRLNLCVIVARQWFPHIWWNIILKVFMKVFLDDIYIFISRLWGKQVGLHNCRWASSNQLRAWIQHNPDLLEQEEILQLMVFGLVLQQLFLPESLVRQPSDLDDNFGSFLGLHLPAHLADFGFAILYNHMS